MKENGSRRGGEERNERGEKEGRDFEEERMEGMKEKEVGEYKRSERGEKEEHEVEEERIEAMKENRNKIKTVEMNYVFVKK